MDKTKKIYITDNLCNCKLCKGSKKVETELDREASRAYNEYTHNQVLTGGREPDLITYPADCTVVHWSAKGNPDCDIAKIGEEIVRIPDSVHGCWKIIKNQEISIHAPVNKSAGKYEIVFTRN